MSINKTTSYFDDDEEHAFNDANNSASETESEDETEAADDDLVVDDVDVDVDDELDGELDDDLEDDEEEDEGQEGGAENEDLDEEEEEEENEDKKKRTKKIPPKTVYKKSFTDDNEEEEEENEDDGEMYLQKFDRSLNENYLVNAHPECTVQNYDEILSMIKVVRDKDDIIIDDLHKTIPYLTKYERARILGQRARQIDSGSSPFIKVPENVIDGYIIAEMELKEKRIPFIIRRPLPHGGS